MSGKKKDTGFRAGQKSHQQISASTGPKGQNKLENGSAKELFDFTDQLLSLNSLQMAIIKNMRQALSKLSCH